VEEEVVWFEDMVISFWLEGRERVDGRTSV
jgi:hypothetical protein